MAKKSKKRKPTTLEVVGILLAIISLMDKVVDLVKKLVDLFN